MKLLNEVNSSWCLKCLIVSDRIGDLTSANSYAYMQLLQHLLPQLPKPKNIDMDDDSEEEDMAVDEVGMSLTHLVYAQFVMKASRNLF